MTLDRTATAVITVTRARSQAVSARLFAPAVFLGAFLIFQIQPLIAKLILPWFGGSAAVWITCLMFFQLALLGGYAGSHWLAKQRSNRQAAIYIGFLALSLLFLPILPAAGWKPVPGQDPLLRILSLLAATIGLPYLLLACAGPLLQSWYSRLNSGAPPWRLFALSNAGSMAGLLTYPVLFEPWLSNREQAWFWSIGFGVFAALCAPLAWQSRAAVSAPALAKTARPRAAEYLLWITLAACPSALLLAVTSHVTQNIAAIPFLWILPLSLYLCSFILSFESHRWYPRDVFACLAAVSLPALAWAISGTGDIRDIRASIAFVSLAAFVLFMVCHGELARCRPAPEHLTGFYLAVAAGGAAGGVLVGLVAPYALNALYDPPAVVSLSGILLACLFGRELGIRGAPSLRLSRLIIAGLLVTYCVLLTDRYSLTAMIALAAVSVSAVWICESFGARRIILYAMAVGLAAGVTSLVANATSRSLSHSLALIRNFYGALAVYDAPSSGVPGSERILRHGTIEHGEQFLSPAYQRYPTAYYARNSGVGLAVQSLMPQGPLHIGMIGLGAGTLLAYARPIDRYSIYEINPAVIRIAQTQFTFLSASPAPYRIIPGDARLSLATERPNDFDLLALDAFSGDAIPIHLLTREAFSLYWRHLKPDGVLAVHVTNRYVALGPVVAMGAMERGKAVMMVSSPAATARGELASDWVLVTSRRAFFDSPNIAAAARPIQIPRGLRMWTDDYSNLYRSLR